jgi:Activator of Hsp90 ATPase homolog 1-like protein
MSNENLTIAYTVEQSPEEAFAAITNVRDWWSGDIDGSTDQLGAVFTYRYQDVHRSTQRITELIPARRITWHVEDSYLDFVQDETEWDGTDVIFEVTPTEAGTEVRFRHVGLVPAVECFDNCSNAWQFYIGGSLRNLIAKGQGQPNEKEASED